MTQGSPFRLFDPAPWRRHAACRGMGPELFWAERGHSPHTTGPAIALCNTCPVRGECLAYALDNNEAEGVWGGTSARERKRIKRQQRKDSAA